jgi:hypothetical protein
MFYTYGHFLKYEKYTNRFSNINDRAIVGCIILSFIAVILNFFFPLGKEINTIILIIGIIVFFFKRRKNFKKKEIYFLILSSIITSILIIYSNVNRPDAGLYHLPYVSFLNENKIIFGLSNIHFRFGTVSIIQYLSAINNNLILNEIAIVLPLASIVSFFVIYFFNNVIKIFKKIEILSLENLFSLFIIIFISYKINRYSSFGNDAVAHLSYFYLISKIIGKKNMSLNFISLISVFIFLNKTTMIPVLIIPLIFFIKEFNFKNFKIIYSFASIFFIFWIIKNIIISGCAIYPLEKSCINSLNWTDVIEAKYESTSGEAWSKDWPNRIDKKISMEEYNKDFNWIYSWSKNHGIYLIKTILPYMLVVIFIYIFLKDKKSRNIIRFDKNFNIIYLLIISLTGLTLFFLKFPLYRYGYSFLITSFILMLLSFQINLDRDKLTYYSKIIFIICLVIFSGKQFLRFGKNINSEYFWPRIYTFNENVKISAKKIKVLDDFTIFKHDDVCMYSASPCTSYELKENLSVLKKYNYYFVNVKDPK